MIYKDYYQDLGVAPTATAAQIKKAYRELAKRYHPDKSKGVEGGDVRFMAINEANEVLSDPAKRKKYDQFGADWKRYEKAGAQPGGFDWSKYAAAQGGQSEQGGSRGSGSPIGDTSVEDLFEILFGQRSGARSGRRSVVFKGGDLEAETTLSLEEAYHGAARLIQLNGQTIKVVIKPGVADGQALRVPGKGGFGEGGGSNGDLYLRVRIAPHPLYLRKGNDLHQELPVGLYTAILGGKTLMQTLKGKVTVTIPSGTPNRKELSLHGLGMPVYAHKGRYGNLLVTVSIVLPEHLDQGSLDLFRTLSARQQAVPE